MHLVSWPSVVRHDKSTVFLSCWLWLLVSYSFACVEMTDVVSGGASNSTHSLTVACNSWVFSFVNVRVASNSTSEMTETVSGGVAKLCSVTYTKLALVSVIDYSVHSWKVEVMSVSFVSWCVCLFWFAVKWTLCCIDKWVWLSHVAKHSSGSVTIRAFSARLRQLSFRKRISKAMFYVVGVISLLLFARYLYLILKLKYKALEWKNTFNLP